MEPEGDYIKISQSEIINQSYFNAVKLNNGLICEKCNLLNTYPKICEKCNKCFCNKCIQEYQNKNKGSICSCKQSSFKYNKMLRVILNLFKFKCHNGCGGEIFYKDIRSHYNSDCPKIDPNKKVAMPKKVSKTPKAAGLKEMLSKSVVVEKHSKKPEKKDTSKSAIPKEEEKKEPSKEVKEKKEPSTKEKVETLMALGKLIIALEKISDLAKEKGLPHDTFKSKHHEHPLVHYGRHTDPKYNHSWRCDICRKTGKYEDENYYCGQCDFDLCMECKNKE
ncbi:MAG: DC1 domain-containing protein [archaeon]|nr:DC1 domain-containing protein [archaeon]